MISRIRAQEFFRQITLLLDECGPLALCQKSGVGFLRTILQMTDPILLPYAAEVSARYFQPKPTDIFLLNDPYSGGSDLSQITFVGCLTSQWFAVHRVNLKPKVYLTDHIDKEGIRIPPTPLLTDGELNSGVLSAIRQHPLCPEDFDRRVPPFLQQFRQQLNRMRDAKHFQNFLQLESQMADVLEISLNQWRERLREIHPAEATEEIQLDDRSRIRLKTIVKNGEIILDFAGTSISKTFGMTDRATAGVCFSTLLLLLGWKGPVHSKMFDCLKVLTPMGSMVNAKFPAPLSLGLRDGAGLISLLMTRTLSHIDKSFEVAESSPSHCAFSMMFEDNSHFYETADPGAPAVSQHAGLSGLSLWRQLRLRPSIEKVEEKYPLKFHIAGLRQNSGGKGEFDGGTGITKEIEVLKSAKLTWQFLPYPFKPEGSHGGKSGTPPAISVRKKGEIEAKDLGFYGECQLQAGDHVIVQSAGGGGFGVVPTSE